MFHSARLKLTAWYILIIMLISIAFSMAIYKELTIELTRFERIHRQRIEEGLPPEGFRSPRIPIEPTTELIDESKQRILILLGVVNFVILTTSGGLAYFLAGRTLKPIKEMVDAQNQFISDASHELKTPLTALKSSMEVGLRDKNFSTNDARLLIKDSLSDVDKLQALSEGLLALARYEKHNGNFKLTKISTSQIIQNSVNRVKNIAALKKIGIKNTDKNLSIPSNAESLTDLLVIFLDNAIKYSPPKSEIEIGTRKNDGTVIIYVKDQGIGVDKDELPKIFDRFYRTDKSRTKLETDGYGLGLSIAKKIAGRHHGTIDVESRKQKGSTFSVKLPSE